MTSPVDPESEVAALRRKNAELSEQVTEMVRVSTRMHRLRATLEARQRVYRALAHFLGEDLPKAADVDAVAARAATFVAYEIGFERVIVMADCLDRVHHVGFWDDETLPDRVLSADHDLGVGMRVHTLDAPDPGLASLVHRLGMIEFVCLPLCGTDGAVLGWMGFGSSADGAPTSSRVTGQDADQLDLVRSLGSAIAVAMENRLTTVQMRFAVDRAEAASLAKSRFVANMTHELRTPLNAIIGYTELVSEMLDERGLARAFAHDQSRVLQASRRLLHLVDDVLDLARVESGALRVDCALFDVGTMVSQVVAEVAPFADRNRNELDYRLVNPTADPTMMSDSDRVRQILVNLLTNANKFTEDGEVVLTATLDSGTVTFTVADTGIGMSDKALARIFRPFEQADNSATRRYGGTGLGLHITEHLVTLLGGTIVARSELGRGSTFEVTLPREPVRGTTPPRVAAR
ncbi:MAG: HAMP domain-containing sensor histidine kinase [Myxococcota bacterium]